jgi:hypothetical protein
MMGRQDRDQGQLFYEFSLDEMIRRTTCYDGLTCLRGGSGRFAPTVKRVFTAILAGPRSIPN